MALSEEFKNSVLQLNKKRETEGFLVSDEDLGISGIPTTEEQIGVEKVKEFAETIPGKLARGVAQTFPSPALTGLSAIPGVGEFGPGFVAKAPEVISNILGFVAGLVDPETGEKIKEVGRITSETLKKGFEVKPGPLTTLGEEAAISVPTAGIPGVGGKLLAKAPILAGIGAGALGAETEAITRKGELATPLEVGIGIGLGGAFGTIGKGVSKALIPDTKKIVNRTFKKGKETADIPDSAFAKTDDPEVDILKGIQITDEQGALQDLRKAIRPIKEKRITEVESVDDRLVRGIGVILVGPKGLKPQNLRQGAESIVKKKREVYSKYNGLLKQAGKGEDIVPTQSIAEEFDVLAESFIKKGATSDVQKVNSMITGFTNPGGIAREKVSLDDLNGFLQNVVGPRMGVLLRKGGGTASAEFKMLKTLSNKINKTMDSIIEAQGGAGFRELKKDYGALKTLENSIAGRIGISERQAPFNLVDQITLVNQAINTGDPVSFLKNAGINLALKKIKEVNSPDNLFKKAVESIEKDLLKGAGPKTGLSEFKEIPNLSAEAK